MMTIAVLCLASQLSQSNSGVTQDLFPKSPLVAVTNGYQILEGPTLDAIAIVRPAGTPTVELRQISGHPHRERSFAVAPFDVISGIGVSGRIVAIFPLSNRQALAGVNALPARNYLIFGVAPHRGKLETNIRNSEASGVDRRMEMKSGNARELWTVGLVTTPQSEIHPTGGMNATLVRAVADACAVDAHDPLHDPYTLALDFVRSDRSQTGIDDRPLVSPLAEGVFARRLDELIQKATPVTRLKLLAVKMSSKIEGSTIDFVDELERVVNQGQDEGPWDTCSTGLRNIERPFVTPALCDRMARIAGKAKSPVIADFALRNAGFPTKERQEELLTILDRPEPELRWRFLTSLANWNHRPELEPKVSAKGIVVDERGLIQTWRTLISAR